MWSKRRPTESAKLKPAEARFHVRYQGYCSVCEQTVVFSSPSNWYRDHLRCENCDSIVRERAAMFCLDELCPDWRKGIVHESSPAGRAYSKRLVSQCESYIALQFFPGSEPGSMVKGFRCENLEAMTFEDGSIDVHIHLDVMEHVNFPSRCVKEMYRTLRPGGKAVFTTPVYEGRVQTMRRALYTSDGVEHFVPKDQIEYHGNPVDENGALVTFHYGSDLGDLILEWAPGFSCNMVTLAYWRTGVVGKFREVFVLTKPELEPENHGALVQ